MKHCGKEHCEGQWCQHWDKCKGETIPPWNCGQHPTTTAAVSIREQDILEAADALADAASEYICKATTNTVLRLNDAIHAYNAAKCGMTLDAYMAKLKGEQV